MPCPSPQPACRAAVSYTHLDVYKRQISHLEKHNLLSEFSDGFLHGISLYVDDMRLLKNICNAVSYTHRDVYKRQRLSRYFAMCRERRTAHPEGVRFDHRKAVVGGLYQMCIRDSLPAGQGAFGVGGVLYFVLPAVRQRAVYQRQK